MTHLLQYVYTSRKLRDEYDKLEGALRKLGVDPELVVGGHAAPVAHVDEDDDFGDDDDDDEAEDDEYGDVDLGGLGLVRRGVAGMHPPHPPHRGMINPLSGDGCEDIDADGDGGIDEMDMGVDEEHVRLQPRRHLDILEEVGCT